ncbi:MAG: GntR family transcriptional regulator [Gammaproteobacteria bacterium]|jgi:DNA-binding GntR family transcriptional regulator|nr:GntR family transcriptional regulator [Gammaproteobacteria bacterium]|tara:strand:- start:376 stop:1050 length:675 start_codon:yes stop_codon:yes gene_type:complete
MDPHTQSKTSTLADGVFDQIRTAIVKGELPPGSKVSEPQLSKQYGISRGPLREAIRRLEGCKLVEIQPNVGASVVSLDSAQAIEIYEIRESLEGLACRLAAKRCTTEDCSNFRDLLTKHEKEIQSEDGRLYYQKEGDLDFHYLIVQLSGNRRLFHLLCEELYHLIRLCRVQTSSQQSRPEQAFKEHHQIVDALESNDGELAEILMRRHISSARATLLDQLGNAR